MTTPDQPEKATGRANRYIIGGIVLVLILIASLMLRSQPASQPSAAETASPPTLQISLPQTVYPTLSPSAPEFTIAIESIGNSGVTATATFKDIGGSVAILLDVNGSPGEESEEAVTPVELRYGTCANPGALAYPMSAPDAGKSESDLPINLSQLNAQRPLAVILYRSVQDHTAIACGDVPAQP